MYDSYLSKFKVICEQMERQFFDEEISGPFIFGEDAGIFDFSLYHDLVAVMCVTGLGDGNQLFSQSKNFTE